MRHLVALVSLTVLVATGLPTADAAALTDSQRSKVVSWGVSQVGHREQGTSNCSAKINRWVKDMGFRVPPCRPWCGAFVHQAFLRAGVTLSNRMITPDKIYGDAIAGERGFRRISISSARPGDILLYRIRKGLRASHMGIVRVSAKRGIIKTVEGNIAHAVVLKDRFVSTPVMAVRVTK